MKTILITGATDGIGLATAKKLANQGHHLILHGRDKEKLKNTRKQIRDLGFQSKLSTYLTDLSNLEDVKQLSECLLKNHTQIDVLINNAGVFKTSTAMTKYGIDIRFVVNVVAPLILIQKLLPIIPSTGRIINLSSAAQHALDLDALIGKPNDYTDMEIYAQSKLALIMLSFGLSHKIGQNGPSVIAVNPGSLLASKMVREAFNQTGKDINIGAQILCEAALEPRFENVSGQYFDNDAGNFAPPHPDGTDLIKCQAMIDLIQKEFKIESSE